MKATAATLLRSLILLLIIQQRSLAQTFYNPIGPATGSDSGLYDDQFLGARFSFSNSVTVVSVSGEFHDAWGYGGSYFAALVPLPSMTALPTGNPAAGVPFNPGEVMSYRTFTAYFGGTPQILTIPFAINLPSGVYGVVFGRGLFGTSASGGGMPRYNDVPTSAGFYWSNQPWRWANAYRNQNNIMITCSAPLQCSISWLGTNTYRLSWPFAEGVSYTVESCTSLVNRVWSPVAPTNQWPISATSWTNTFNSTESPQFFRVNVN
jgi:hypothetical protein